MKYFVTIGSREYEISIRKTEIMGQAGMSVLLDGEEFVVNLWRIPDSPFTPSS
ncbi:MAG TPA: hypothetical protein VI387_01000 [Candidatus Brocadiales bacterium]|nr:hypothetical protein [Candidatus Brocadiales bacterium]